MILGRVVGQVWATRQAERLGGSKILVVRPHGWFLPEHDVEHLVALDQLGAGIGEEVVVCCGSPARWNHGGVMMPIDAAVMAIVDGWTLDEPKEG